MATELALLPTPLPPALPAHGPSAVAEVPPVRPGDLFAALLADAHKPTTRRAREQDVNELARFLGLAGGPAACAAFVEGGAPRANAIATGFVQSMLARKLSTATANRRVSTLRRLVKLAQRFGLIGWALDIDTLPVQAFRDTSGPGRAGWLRMLDCATRVAARTVRGKRDLGLIRLLHDSGLRRAEVSGLDLADLDMDAGRAWIVGKGKREKSPVPLNAPTLKALSVWLDARGTEPGPLFVRLDNARPKGLLCRLDGDGILDAVAALGRRAKLTRRVRAHGLRHEAVSRVLELTNGNIDAAQKFARHADPKTTQIYNDRRKDVAGQMARLLGEDA